MAPIVVGASLRLAGTHRQQELRQIERLDLALVVHAQHQGALGRIEIVELPRFRGHLNTWDLGVSRQEVHMARTRKPYPAEFRAEAVRLVRSGSKLSAVAHDLGVSSESLRNWMKQQDIDDRRRADGLTTDEREELRQLRRENRVLREEREILVRASAFFATEIGSTRSRGSGS